MQAGGRRGQGAEQLGREGEVEELGAVAPSGGVGGGERRGEGLSCLTCRFGAAAAVGWAALGPLCTALGTGRVNQRVRQRLLLLLFWGGGLASATTILVGVVMEMAVGPLAVPAPRPVLQAVDDLHH